MFDFRNLRKLTARAKIELVKNSKNSMGSMLLSALTPTQLAELFPDYYKKNIDIGGFIAAVTSKKSKQQQQAMDQQISRTVQTEVDKRETKAKGRREKEAEKQLTPEQKAAIEELKKGQIAADDPRVAFLSSLSPEQMKNAGIGLTNDKEGKSFYKWLPTEFASLSDDQVKERMMPHGTFEVKAPVIMKRLQDEFSLTKEEAAVVLGNLGHESNGFRSMQEKLSPDKIAKGWRGGLGWAQWTADRRDKYIAWAQSRGLDTSSDEANLSFLIHELKTSHASAIAALKNAQTREEKMRVFENLFEGSSAKNWDSRYAWMNKALEAPLITKDYSAEAIAARREQLIREEEAKRIGSLEQYVGSTPGPSMESGGSRVPGTIFNRVEEQQGNAKTRTMPIQPRLKSQLDYAAEQAGVRVEVFSGGQPESGPNRTGGHRHDLGGAADVRLYRVDKQGNKHYLSMTDDADREVMGRFIENSVKAGAQGIGAAPDYMGNSGIHVGGGGDAVWGASRSRDTAQDWVVAAHERGKSQREAFQQELAAQEQQKTQTAKIEPKLTPELNPDKNVRHNPSLTEPTPKVMEPPTRELKRDPREFLSGNQAPPVPTKEQGGDVQVASKEISAYPIGGIGSDNTVVVDKDQKPVFTMDTKREAAVYTPGDSKVSVIPQERVAKGPMEDQQPSPNVGVDEKISQVKQEMQQSIDGLFKKVNKAQAISSPRVRDPHMIDSLAIKVPFLSPSYYRAMTRTRFQETGDAIDQHHYSDKTTSIS